MPRFTNSGAGGGSSSGGWVCNDAPVAVKVGGGTEIPTQSVKTYISKDGIADVNKLTEVHFPTTWKGRSVIDEISAFQPGSSSGYDLATVIYRGSGAQRPIQRGYVRSVGGTGTTGLMKMYIADPATMLSAIPFSGVYTEPSVSEILDDIISEFREHTIFKGAQYQTSAPDKEVDPIPLEGYSGFLKDPVRYFSQGLKQPLDRTDRTQVFFKQNRDTLADALDFLVQWAGGYYYWQIQNNRATLIYDPTASHDAIDGSSLGIIENDALLESAPITTLIANGATGVSIGGHELAFVPGKKFPQVKVEHSGLVDRTGGRVPPKIVDAKATSLKSTESVAKRRLKKAIEGASQGDMLMHGAPQIDVFDKITARPVCQEQVDTSVSPLDYEVQSITHECVEGVYRSRVATSVYANYGDISVVESKMVEQ